MEQREAQQDGTLLPAVGRHRYVNINLFEFMRPFWSSPDSFATSITQRGRDLSRGFPVLIGRTEYRKFRGGRTNLYKNFIQHGYRVEREATWLNPITMIWRGRNLMSD